MRHRKAEAVLEGARELFLERGYEATTVDDIAAAAHVSKATVYNNFADKAAVLTALLDRAAAESNSILTAVIAPLAGPGDVEDRLRRTIATLARGVLRPEVLQLRRLAIAESSRFPVEVASFYALGPASTVRLLADALRTIDSAGDLRIPDPEIAAAHLAYAAVGPLQDRALLNNESIGSDEADRMAIAAADAFLAAHRSR